MTGFLYVLLLTNTSASRPPLGCFTSCVAGNPSSSNLLLEFYMSRRSFFFGDSFPASRAELPEAVSTNASEAQAQIHGFQDMRQPRVSCVYSTGSLQHGLQCCSPWAGAKESAHFFFSGSLWQFELRSSLGRATQQYDASDCSSTLRRTTLTTRPCTKRWFSRYRKAVGKFN